VVCGPTASGKSEVSDALAEVLSEENGGFVPTLVVDSMQVYREIPKITNQARRRPAELVGIVSVTERWTVANHKARAEQIVAGTETPFVLDAGTGMYLNAIILDVPLAPKVVPSTRRIAENLVSGAENHRRASRQKELELAGVPSRRSIWDGEPRYDTAVIYLRPNREALDFAISRRSEKIAREGLGEAAKLMEMERTGSQVNASVADSIGVRELAEYLSGWLTLEEARSRMTTRTLQLARRQIRWFDKLSQTLRGRVPTAVLEKPKDVNTMHGNMWA
jgi:tRNA dimethylallyltransferase